MQLSAINPDHTQQIDGVELEKIYISLPVKMGLSVELQDYEVIDWWLIEREKRWSLVVPIGKNVSESQKIRPTARGWQETVFELLVDQLQEQLNEAYIEDMKNGFKDMLSLFSKSTDDGVFPDRIVLEIEHIAAACPRLVVLGGPGSGKSSFARHLALCLAGEQRENWRRNADLTQIQQWPHGELTPVYVELRQFISTMFSEDVTTQPKVDDFWNFVTTRLLGANLADYAISLRNDLDEGRGLIILDGLDEVPYPSGRGNLQKRQTQLKALVQQLGDAFGQTRILVTSRPYAYEGWSLPGFSAVELAPFEDDQQMQLASNLYRACGDEDAEADERAQRFNDELKHKNISPELTNTPLFITLMATVYTAGGAEGLPTRKGALYRQSILLLLERWTNAKTGVPTLAELLGTANRDDLLARLAALAYEVHERFGEKQALQDIPRELLAKHIFDMGMDDSSVKAVEIVAYLSETAGVLVSLGNHADGHAFRFAHRTFQEYLAAIDIVAQCSDSYDSLKKRIESRPQLWRTPCLLVADVLRDRDNARDAYENLWGLIEVLSSEDVPDQIQSDDPRWWSIWLASAITLEQELFIQDISKQRGKRAIKDNLIVWLVKLIETPQALLPIERATCGRALGLLGDPRIGVGNDPITGLPQIEWCDIPSGTLLVGRKSQQDLDASQKEDPQYKVTLDAYRISRYPITYAQYATFVNDSGYSNREFWTASGWSHKGNNLKPKECWDDPKWNINNHPVVGVTWYEAFAFCRWLTTKLGYEIRLPTESEWEWAARGDEALIYPYGTDGDANKGNYRETGIGRTSAVGLFPDGECPNGLADMSGNVCEWCGTKLSTSYTEGEDNNPNDTDGVESRRLRGGSWLHPMSRARSTFRDGDGAFESDVSTGFRICSLITNP